jgi:hypothetical protein
LTDALATEAMGICAGAAVIGVGVHHACPCVVARGHASQGVATAAADQQALQEVARPRRALAPPLLILAQLLLYRREERGLDDGRHGHADPLLRRDRLGGSRAAGVRAAATRLPQERRALPGAIAGASVGGLALVGWMMQDQGDGTATPAREARGRGHPLATEATRHHRQRDAISAHPLEQLADHARLIERHLIARGRATRSRSDVAIAIRRTRQGRD